MIAVSSSPWRVADDAETVEQLCRALLRVGDERHEGLALLQRLHGGRTIGWRGSRLVESLVDLQGLVLAAGLARKRP